MTREELFKNLKAGARWDVGVSINRSNSLPLDANSIFESYAAAAAYASKDADRIAEYGFLNNAYIGQILAVIEDKTIGEETVTTVGIYYIDANLQLQPVGKEVIADGNSIVNDNGTIKLYGFDAAATATYPRKTADGKIEWVTVQELVEGATENTVTVGDNISIDSVKTETGYTVKLKGIDTASSGQVPFYNETETAEGTVKSLVWKDVYTKSEVDAKVAGMFSYKGSAAGAPTDEGKNILVGDTTITASEENIGHVYIYNGKEYVSNGSIWEELGFEIDLSGYYTKGEVDAAIDADVKVETERATAAENALSGRIDTLEAFDHSIYAVKSEVNESFEVLGNKDTELSGKITALETAVGGESSGLVKDVADLKTLTGNHSGTLETLRTDVDSKLATATFNEYIVDKSMSDTELKEYADNLVSPISADITTLKTDVTDLKSATADIATIRSDVATNKTDVATLKTTINGDGTEGSGLVTKVAKLEQANVDHKAEYTTLKGIVDGHSELLTGISDTTVKALIDEAKKAGTDAATAAEEAKGLVTALENGKVATNANNISAIEGRVAALEGQISGVTGAMHFEGVKDAIPEDVSGYENGDVIIVGEKEYVFSDGAFVELGDTSAYALKDNVYTKAETDAKLEAALSWNDME